jgi:hypothetical protein
LKQLQTVMAGHLFRSLTSADGMQPDTVADDYIKPNDRLTSFERLEIYNRQYWYRILDCLYDDYPGLRALLGQRRFHKLSRAYLAKYPSASWTLRNLGRRLEQFMREEPEWAGPKQAQALDIVRFEWAQVLAFDEARKKPLPLDDLLGADPSQLHLNLQPYLSLIELDHAVDDYFMAVRKQDSGLRSEASNALDHAPKRAAFKRVPMPKQMKLWLAVHRCDNDIYFKRLPREAFLLLTRLKAGDTLMQSLEAALANADPAQDWTTQIRDWFQNWSALGWFCR